MPSTRRSSGTRSSSPWPSHFSLSIPLPVRALCPLNRRRAHRPELQGSRSRRAGLRRAGPGGRRDPASRAWRGVGMAGAAMAAGTRSLGPTEAGAQAPAMASREDGSSARLPGRSSGGREGTGGPTGGQMGRRSATASLPKERSCFPNAIAKRARCRIRWKLIFEGVRFFYRCWARYRTCWRCSNVCSQKARPLLPVATVLAAATAHAGR